uniref:holo-[acyl-carrier-protein] synthase n=1 Tax=Odontella aurita TaxID=265563 RepID=A0A7S4IB54_9STRA|mmetsp:Transcript_22454/g.66583  ORF Transcript_22454/g.66583 Transcript_22454/m.66583 type:complete len:672 (+) Transcript_22454:870-2885(+)
MAHKQIEDLGEPFYGQRCQAHSKCVKRWFMNIDEWKPSTEEWSFALQQILPSDRDKVERYVFEMDRKLALGSRLLQRFCVRSVLGLENGEYEIARTKENKPYLKVQGGSKARTVLNQMGVRNLTFNVSHHGSIVALACEPDCVVGLDVVKETERPGGVSTTDAYFEIFAETFTEEEWRVIRSGKTEDARFREFYRHWSMKEAYVKAHGYGLGVDLQSLSFRYLESNEDEHHVARAKVLVQGNEPNIPWSFAIMRIDSDHVATVCRAPPQNCHPSFAACLADAHISTDEMEKSLTRAQPPFERVCLSDLVVPVRWEQLHRVRHPNHLLQQLSQNMHYGEIAEFSRRWLIWLYSKSYEHPIQCAATPTVYALSVKHDGPMELSLLIKTLCPCPNAVLLVTGDLTSNLHQLKDILCLLKDKFIEVFFTVGPLELQVNEKEQNSTSSLRKLMDILEMCDSLNVRTRPCTFEVRKEPHLTVVPLLSWHNMGPCSDSALKANFTESIKVAQTSGTISAFSWFASSGTRTQMNFSSKISISKFLAELNVQVQQQLNSPRLEKEIGIANGAGGKLRPMKPSANRERTPAILSFSHFGVKSSEDLQTQIQNLSADAHIFCEHSYEANRFRVGETDRIQVTCKSGTTSAHLETVWPLTENKSTRRGFISLSSVKAIVENLF